MELTLYIIGYLGRNCSIRHNESGNTAITFPVCTTETWLDKQGVKHEQQTWIECTLWRKADKLRIADFLIKGALVKCSGRPVARGWKAKQSDEIKAGIDLRVDDLKLLSVPKEQPAQQAENSTSNDSTFTSSQEDDLPF